VSASPSSAAPLQLVQAPVDPVVVQRAEELLEKCKRGEVQGFVVLINGVADAYNSGYAGVIHAGSIILSFERWKHDWISGLEGR
jgi:hypothetical protein